MWFVWGINTRSNPYCLRHSHLYNGLAPPPPPTHQRTKLYMLLHTACSFASPRVLCGEKAPISPCVCAGSAEFQHHPSEILTATLWQNFRSSATFKTLDPTLPRPGTTHPRANCVSDMTDAYLRINTTREYRERDWPKSALSFLYSHQDEPCSSPLGNTLFDEGHIEKLEGWIDALDSVSDVTARSTQHLC